MLESLGAYRAVPVYLLVKLLPYLSDREARSVVSKLQTSGLISCIRIAQPRLQAYHLTRRAFVVHPGLHAAVRERWATQLSPQAAQAAHDRAALIASFTANGWSVGRAGLYADGFFSWYSEQVDKSAQDIPPGKRAGYREAVLGVPCLARYYHYSCPVCEVEAVDGACPECRLALPHRMDHVFRCMRYACGYSAASPEPHRFQGSACKGRMVLGDASPFDIALKEGETPLILLADDPNRSIRYQLDELPVGTSFFVGGGVVAYQPRVRIVFQPSRDGSIWAPATYKSDGTVYRPGYWRLAGPRVREFEALVTRPVSRKGVLRFYNQTVEHVFCSSIHESQEMFHATAQKAIQR